MFEGLFGEQAKLTNAVDTYLYRMDKVLKIKMLAKQVKEPAVDKDMNLFIKTISEAAAKALRDASKTEEK